MTRWIGLTAPDGGEREIAGALDAVRYCIFIWQSPVIIVAWPVIALNPYFGSRKSNLGSVTMVLFNTSKTAAVSWSPNPIAIASS
jgi:hypothetical protein